MRKRALISILGLLVLVLGGILLIPLGVALHHEESGEVEAFLLAIATCLGFGGTAYLSCRGSRGQLGPREGFAIVGLGWTVLSAFAALPFHLTPQGIPSYLDAYFETISGFTTTGASILTDIEALPRSLLFWRAMTNWLGGMGIVVLTVAILPFLGAGGYQMLRAEAPGPTADKLMPRIRHTAQWLWMLYLLLTLILVGLLTPVMGFFEGTCHAFATLATGGFSTRNASVAAFDSAYIDGVITLFMFIAGANFVLHYRLIMGRSLLHLKDTEFRFYTAVVLVSILGVTAFLWWGSYPDRLLFPGKYDTVGECVRYSSFQVLGVMSTTGFATADFDRWPNACRVLLVALMVFGGCAGSTSGGVKCIRVMLLFKFGLREIKRLVRPHAVIPLKMGGEVIDRAVIARVMGFLSLYLVVFFISVLLMATILGSSPADGVERVGELPSLETENSALLTAFGSVLATLGNIGPGLAGVGPTENFADIPATGKGLLILLMLLGRLEIYAVLVVLIPLTWRK
jgi:trk system potassium uptake protein TrkH